MAHPGKAPSLEVLGYNYWKTRMKAYLLSQGSEIWDITQNAAYVIPEQRTTPLQVDQYNANNKAVNMLFAAVGDAEFQRVCHLTTAHEIWTILADHLEGQPRSRPVCFRLTGVNMRISPRSRGSRLRRCLIIFNRSLTSSGPTRASQITFPLTMSRLSSFCIRLILRSGKQQLRP